MIFHHRACCVALESIWLCVTSVLLDHRSARAIQERWLPPPPTHFLLIFHPRTPWVDSSSPLSWVNCTTISNSLIMKLCVHHSIHWSSWLHLSCRRVRPSASKTHKTWGQFPILIRFLPFSWIWSPSSYIDLHSRLEDAWLLHRCRYPQSAAKPKKLRVLRRWLSAGGEELSRIW